MATFQIAHGLSMAPNSWIENARIEKLASDPTPSVAGRVWYNTTDKYFKMSGLDGGGAIVVRKFATMDDLAAHLTNMASTTTDSSGTSLVGYDGQTGTNGKFSLSSGQLDNSIDAIVQKVDDVQNDLDTNESSTASIQSELDATQTGAGLETDGSYSTPVGTNYLDSASSLYNADNLLDTQAKANADAIAAEVIDRENADALKVDKAGDSMSGSLEMASNRVTGLAEPVDSQDAATKNYVDNTVQGLDPKASCRVATTSELDATYDSSALTLTANNTGELIVDGVTLNDADRVLVKNQTDETQNGIYIVSATGGTSSSFILTRSVDFDNDPVGEVSPGAFTFVEEGTINDNNGFVVTTDAPTGFTLDTDNVLWQQFSGAGSVIAGTGLGKSGNELFINLGAGIYEKPGDEVGVDFHPSGGLFTTADNSSESLDANAQVALKLDNSDSVFGATLTKGASGVRIASSVTGKIDTIETHLDQTQEGAGLGTAGGYTAPAGSNYISSATSLFNADSKLDAQIKTNADGLATEISDRQSADSALQTELDDTQSGAGLGTAGGYTAPAGSNYLTAATSLFNADSKLDAQIKTNADNLSTEIGNRQTADSNIQSELDTTQTGAGLNSDGTYSAPGSANYLSGATSLFNAEILLDTQIKVNADNLASEVSHRQTDINNVETTVNNQVYKVDKSSATTHTINHGLNTQNVEVTVWVKDTSGKWKNDLVGIVIDDANNLSVELTEAHEIRCIVRSSEDISLTPTT